MTPSEASGSTPPSPPLGLREQARRDRYIRIRKAAEDLFAEKSYDEVTTKEVARRAGVGEATLFRYIAHKEELLLLVVGERQETFIDRVELDDDIRGASPPEPMTGDWVLQRILDIYRARSAFYAQDPDHVSKYVISGLQSENKLGPLSTLTGDRIVSRVEHILQQGQQARVIRGDTDAGVVARNVNGTYIHEILRSPARRLPIETIWERLSERLLVMLLPLVVHEACTK